MSKKGNIFLEINGEVVEGPRGFSIKELKYKETSSNGDNIYEVIREDNRIIGEITAKKGEQGIQGIQGNIGNGIKSIILIFEGEKSKTYRIKYTNGEFIDFSTNDGEDGISAYNIAVENGFEGTEEEWLLSLIGRGLEFNWEENKLGVRVEGEIEYLYSDNLKGEKGDRGDIGPGNILSIGNVEKGEQAQVTINGESPEQVLNFVLPKGDKGEVGEKGDQGEQGKKGNGIVRTQFVREDNEKVYYKFIYDDGSEFQWSTWKGEAGVPVSSFIIGDLLPYNAYQPLEDEWLSLTNYKPLPSYQYEKLSLIYGTVDYYWERLVPTEDIVVEATGYDSAYSNGIGELPPVEMTALKNMMPDILAGGLNRTWNYFSFPHSLSSPPRDTTLVHNICAHIYLYGMPLETEGIVNEPILVIGQFGFRGWRYVNDFVYNLTATGRAGQNKLAHGTGILFDKTKQTDLNYHQDMTQNFEAGFVYWNNLMHQQSIVSENLFSQRDSFDWQRVGIAIEVPNIVSTLEIKRLEFWRKVRATDGQYYVDIPPHLLVPNFERKWDYEEYASGENHYLNADLKQMLKIYIGKL